MAHVNRSSVTAVVAGAALVLTAVAVAATPKDGQWTTSGGESSGSFMVKGSSIKPVGTGAYKAITAPSNFKCNSSNLVVKASAIKISRGKFRYVGSAYIDKFRAKTKLGTLTWTGTFTTATKVRGTYRFRTSVTPKPGPTGITFKKRKCDSGTKSWTGKLFVQPATPPGAFG